MNKEIFHITVTGLRAPNVAINQVRKYRLSITMEIGVYHVICDIVGYDYILGSRKKCGEYETRIEAIQGLRESMKDAMRGLLFTRKCALCGKLFGHDRGEKCRDCILKSIDYHDLSLIYGVYSSDSDEDSDEDSDYKANMFINLFGGYQ